MGVLIRCFLFYRNFYYLLFILEISKIMISNTKKLGDLTIPSIDPDSTYAEMILFYLAEATDRDTCGFAFTRFSDKANLYELRDMLLPHIKERKKSSKKKWARPIKDALRELIESGQVAETTEKSSSDGIEEKYYRSTKDMSYYDNLRSQVIAKEKAILKAKEVSEFLVSVPRELRFAWLSSPDNVIKFRISMANLVDAWGHEKTLNWMRKYLGEEDPRTVAWLKEYSPLLTDEELGAKVLEGVQEVTSQIGN